jgi:hypothetical protein
MESAECSFAELDCDRLSFFFFACWRGRGFEYSSLAPTGLQNVHVMLRPAKALVILGRGPD